MSVNPLVDQGSLNKVRGAVNWVNFPELNVSASYLGDDAIGLALEGASTVYIPTLTGAVTSRETYMMIGVSMHLLKTQALSDAYKTRMELNALLGNGTVRPDVSAGLSPYDIINCSIAGVRELRFNGKDNGFVVAVRGYYVINNDLWN